jgi:hypothetical protein
VPAVMPRPLVIISQVSPGWTIYHSQQYGVVPSCVGSGGATLQVEDEGAAEVDVVEDEVARGDAVVIGYTTVVGVESAEELS